MWHAVEREEEGRGGEGEVMWREQDEKMEEVYMDDIHAQTHSHYTPISPLLPCNNAVNAQQSTCITDFGVFCIHYTCV